MGGGLIVDLINLVTNPGFITACVLVMIVIALHFFRHKRNDK